MGNAEVAALLFFYLQTISPFIVPLFWVVSALEPLTFEVDNCFYGELSLFRMPTSFPGLYSLGFHSPTQLRTTKTVSTVGKSVVQGPTPALPSPPLLGEEPLLCLLRSEHLCAI